MQRDGHAAGGPRTRPDPAVGLCAECGHAATQRSARGSLFWRCLAADHDPSLRRYPPLPVTRCHAFDRKRPKAARSEPKANEGPVGKRP